MIAFVIAGTVISACAGFYLGYSLITFFQRHKFLTTCVPSQALRFAEYQAEVARCSAHPTPGADVMVKDALGLAGEVGEVVELIKKSKFHALPLDTDKLRNEIGDVLWYLTDLCAQCGFTLADAAQSNTDKLRLRYPDGFKLGGGVR